MTDMHRCHGSRGWSYNKPGWEGGSITIHFLEDGHNAIRVLKCRKELAKRKKAKKRAAQGHQGGEKKKKVWLEAADNQMTLLWGLLVFSSRIQLFIFRVLIWLYVYSIAVPIALYYTSLTEMPRPLFVSPIHSVTRTNVLWMFWLNKIS